MKKSNYPSVELRKASELKPHPDTLRFATAESLYGLQNSIKEFGILRPPVLNVTTGNLIDGDWLVSALKERGDTEIICYCVELTPEQEEIAHMALNNHVGEWIWQPVSEKLKEINAKTGTLALTGFHPYDTGPLIAADWSPAKVGPLDGSCSQQIGLI